MNVALRVLTSFYTGYIRKTAPPPGGHVFLPTGTIFKFVQDIIGINILTNFHEDRTIHLTPRVKNALTPGSHFHDNPTINVISRVLTRKYAPPLGAMTNLLTRFHEDRTINVEYREKCPAPGGHVFQATVIIFELVQDIVETNLTKLHEDWTINVASIVLTRQIMTPQKATTKAHHEHIVLW
ncbi:hypothetical protein DPMN_012453 [Dreissena polymorpha]|uniref:Uncharacterized protein n=1 Tax=Dreissena polymorpha TaxID=45954 RepID=A0A9D4S2U4_DREPO|nr:hypothetical protein DPMN_012453 [Dreissena polymorpha]